MDIRRTLEEEARKCQWLILWLDCDREGENIAFEVIEVCRAVNCHLVVRRARFSALIDRFLSLNFSSIFIYSFHVLVCDFGFVNCQGYPSSSTKSC